jgi:hypothetical protein
MLICNQNPPGRSFLATPAGVALCLFLAFAAFSFWTENRAYLLDALSWLLLAACPLLHLFMHRSRHGGHHEDPSAVEKTGEPHDASLWPVDTGNSAVFIKHHTTRDLSAVASVVTSPTKWAARSKGTVFINRRRCSLRFDPDQGADRSWRQDGGLTLHDEVNRAETHRNDCGRGRRYPRPWCGHGAGS